MSRSLYFYLKNAHAGVVPGLQEFATSFMSDAASGEEGYLLDKGLIPLDPDTFEEVADAVADLLPMTGEDLH